MFILEHGWGLSLLFLILPLFFVLNLFSSCINAFSIKRARLKTETAIFIPIGAWFLMILFIKSWEGSDYSILLAFSNQNLYTVPTLFYLLPQTFSLIAIKFFRAKKFKNLFSVLTALSLGALFFLSCLNYFYGFVYSLLFRIAVD